MNKKVAIIGYGYVGKAYHKVFPDAYIYNEGSENMGTKEEVNKCDLAIICVPTDLKDGELDTSIVEHVVSWLKTDLILIKSALMPGTVDWLVEKTGKNIAVSVELVGMGNYFTPEKYPDPKNPTKHQTLIIGGEENVASSCAEILWDKMAPTITIHLVSALEAEVTKLVENTYGALKVSWVNCLMSLCDKSSANFIRVHQAWQSDPRVEGMHQRTVHHKRGWTSHCWDKDVPALANYAKKIGASDMADLLNTILEINKDHLKINE